MEFGLTDIWAALGFLAVVVLTAMSGGVFTPGAWYEALRHPSFRPPNWIFPVVWTPLYLMIGVAGFLVWREAGLALLPFAVYAVQLVLNFLWSAIFFGLRRPDWALAEVALLWLAILANIAVFMPIDAVAGWLLVPYLVWVSFAAFLNWTIWRLNPDAHRIAVDA